MEQDFLKKKRLYRNTLITLNNAKGMLRDLQSKLSREDEDISDLKQIISSIDKIIQEKTNLERKTRGNLE
jgi:hypothetical protein